MTTVPATIRQLLEAALQPERLEIEDESWKHAGHAGATEHGGGHYIVSISSTELDALPRHRSHRLVYQALAPLFPEKIHALSIRIEKPHP